MTELVTDELRTRLASYTSRMSRLTPGKSGDFSCRESSRFGVTPTGVTYDSLEPENFPVLDLDGNVQAGELEPSSELPIHLNLYRNLDCGAVVHVHSPWATTLAALGEPLSYVHYAAGLAGPEVPLVEYYTYGSEDLADAVLETMSDAESSACLLANHGMVSVGDSLEEAFDVAEAVEFTARIECQSRMIGSPVELTDDQVRTASEKLSNYGQENPGKGNDDAND